MFAAALIVFREVLEAALIVGIVLAATRGVPGRGRWVSLGIVGGAAAASALAFITGNIANLFNGVGQEIINATILLIAVGLISWHVVWMNKHGREIATRMKQVGQSVSEGRNPMSILAFVVGLAVLREGAEVVLILQGLWTTESLTTMLSGSALGFAGGIFLGGALYLGFLALPIGRLFSATNMLLIMIAAGMAARGANFLAQADLIPTFGDQIWDSSAILSEQSVLGKIMAALTGYISTPNGIELIAYSITIISILGLIQWSKRPETMATASPESLAQSAE